MNANWNIITDSKITFSSFDIILYINTVIVVGEML